MEVLSEFFSLIWVFLLNAWDFFLHLDRHIGEIINDYGMLTYLIIFIIVFCETGLVVTPFLPGDSLLFTLGAFAAIGALNLFAVMALLIAAAILGDTVNYWIGNKLGSHMLARKSRLINPAHVARTHNFFERYGGKTIIIARFVPIIRTFAPFVAGLGSMTYRRFIVYNISGALLWVLSICAAGYFFGNIPVIKNNFSFVVLAIIFISILPGIIEFIRIYARRKKEKTP